MRSAAAPAEKPDVVQALKEKIARSNATPLRDCTGANGKN